MLHLSSESDKEVTPTNQSVDSYCLDTFVQLEIADNYSLAKLVSLES